MTDIVTSTSEYPPYIHESWHRCAAMMHPETWRQPHRALGVTFRSICQRKAALITIAQAALEDALEFMDRRHCALLVLDESACLLESCGHPQTLAALSELGFSAGCYCSESIIGSCALSLAAQLGQPVKTTGRAHFKQALFDWCFCATPVFDNHGRLAGSVALVCRSEETCPGDLPLTLAIAREVGNSLLTDSLLAESNRHLNQLYGLLESMNDGVLAWDSQGIVQFLNPQAAELLLLQPQLSQGQPLQELITLPALLRRSIRKRQRLNHVEVTFESQHQFIDLVVTLKPIHDAQGDSFILLLHPPEQMRQLMTSQISRVSHTFEQMPQQDADSRRLVHFGRQAAKGNFPVLLTGEEGVGKTRLSEAIHNETRQAGGPYIAINCQRFADPDAVADFLGTGPTDEQNGQLSKPELAHGGTLFLDNIEFLPGEIQSALLQVIKQGMVTRLGSQRMIPVDVKIVAATGQNLEDRVAQKQFSRQLYYAFHAFEIHIPPLRQRKASIEKLVRHKLVQLEKPFAVRYRIDDEVLAQLADYTWPGNDFELNTVVENMAMRSDNGRIRLSNLPDYLLSISASGEPTWPAMASGLSFPAIERDAIVHAARVTQGRVLEMSRLLNIGRTTLWRKMKQYHIDARQFRER